MWYTCHWITSNKVISTSWTNKSQQQWARGETNICETHCLVQEIARRPWSVQRPGLPPCFLRITPRERLVEGSSPPALALQLSPLWGKLRELLHARSRMQNVTRPISVLRFWISEGLTQAEGILMFIGDFPEVLSQRILEGIILEGRLCMLRPDSRRGRSWACRTWSSTASSRRCEGSTRTGRSRSALAESYTIGTLWMYVSYIYIYIYIYTHTYIHTCSPLSLFRIPSSSFGWHRLSDAACLMQDRLFSAALLV